MYQIRVQSSNWNWNFIQSSNHQSKLTISPVLDGFKQNRDQLTEPQLLSKVAYVYLVSWCIDESIGVVQREILPGFDVQLNRSSSRLQFACVRYMVKVLAQKIRNSPASIHLRFVVIFCSLYRAYRGFFFSPIDVSCRMVGIFGIVDDSGGYECMRGRINLLFLSGRCQPKRFWTWPLGFVDTAPTSICPFSFTPNHPMWKVSIVVDNNMTVDRLSIQVMHWQYIYTHNQHVAYNIFVDCHFCFGKRIIQLVPTAYIVWFTRSKFSYVPHK